MRRRRAVLRRRRLIAALCVAGAVLAAMRAVAPPPPETVELLVASHRWMELTVTRRVAATEMVRIDAEVEGSRFALRLREAELAADRLGVAELEAKVEDAVGVTDNFFDSGGGSLAMATVQQRLNRLLGRELRVVDLFRYPTVRALAAHLDGAGQSADGTDDAVELALRAPAAALDASLWIWLARSCPAPSITTPSATRRRHRGAVSPWSATIAQA